MPAHSRIAPSKAPRFVYCAGSVPLEEANPEAAQSQEAMEGDAAHHVAATILHDMQQFKQARPIESITAAPNGIVITDEMREAAEIYINDVIDNVGNEALEKLHVEEQISSAAIHPEFWGTSDCWWAAIQPGVGAYINVHDFKYGYRYTDPFENWQMIGYDACILSRPEFAGIDRARIQITNTIVQPRNYHSSGPIRRWVTMADKLAPLFATLSEACHAALSPRPGCRVNDECRDCQGRFECETLQGAADAAMDFAGMMNPVKLTNAALGTELKMIHRAQKMLDARATGLEEQAVSLIRSGQRVPGFMMGQGQAREKWTAAPEDVFMLGDALGVDLRKPPEPITPNQARRAGLDAATVAGFSNRPPGALKLETVDDDKARKVFGT